MYVVPDSRSLTPVSKWKRFWIFWLVKFWLIYSNQRPSPRKLTIRPRFQTKINFKAWNFLLRQEIWGSQNSNLAFCRLFFASTFSESWKRKIPRTRGPNYKHKKLEYSQNKNIKSVRKSSPKKGAKKLVFWALENAECEKNMIRFYTSRKWKNSPSSLKKISNVIEILFALGNPADPGESSSVQGIH